MTDMPPQPRLDARLPEADGLHEGEGKTAAFIAWALYILSIPSAGVLAPIGLVVAYAGRKSAAGIARQHIDAAIGLFWSVFWWTVVTGALIVVSILLAWLILPVLLIFVLWGVLILLSVWFTIKSVLGLVNLASNKAP